MAKLDFDTKSLPADIGASVTMALVAVPDAIASAILAGVNPMYGFNALIVGTPIGSLFTSSQFMNIAIGLLGLIQAAGISQTIPNPDGEYPDPSGDFRGQGIANIASGFFKGLPVGRSVGGTSILLSAGAKSRWANVFMGLFVAILFFYSGIK